MGNKKTEQRKLERRVADNKSKGGDKLPDDQYEKAKKVIRTASKKKK